MKTKTKKLVFRIFAFLSIVIGLYPLLYFIADMTSGLLSSKPELILSNDIWNLSFYTHISLGGLALLIGWTQFNSRFRRKKIELHRDIGKVYMICVLLSGSASLYLACFATGGIIASFGFASLGMIWLLTTLAAFIQIKNGRVQQHQKYMIYSYAACFAAVTLRLWLPLLITATEDFTIAYTIVAWLCWVPNMVVAYFIVKQIPMKQNRFKSSYK